MSGLGRSITQAPTSGLKASAQQNQQPLGSPNMRSTTLPPAPTAPSSVKDLLLLILKTDYKGVVNVDLPPDVTDEALYGVLIQADGGVPSKKLIWNIFDVIVGGPFDQEKRVEIQKTAGFTILMHLFDLCPVSLRTEILARLALMLDRSLSNLGIAHDARLLDRFISIVAATTVDSPEVEAYIDRCLHLIQFLAAFRFTMKQFKSVLALTRTGKPPESFRSPYATRVIKALQNIAAASHVNSYLLFDGMDAGLSVPPFELTKNGYTFCAWIRVETYENVSKALWYEPRLFSFLSKEGSGLEAYFSSKVLFVRTIDKGVISTQPLPFTLYPKRWYFVAIQQWTSFFAMSHQIKLFVDGASAFEANLKYPRTTEPFAFNYIGTGANLTDPKKIEKKASFYGQMAAVYMYKSALSASEIAELHKHGPNYLWSPEKPFSPLYASDNLAFMYHALATSGELCFAGTGDVRMAARRLSGTRAIGTQPLKDLLYESGGVKVLLYLLHLLDMPTKTPQGTISYSIDPMMTSALVTLLADTAALNSTALEQLVEQNACAMLGYVLEKSSPKHLTLDTLMALEKMVKCLTSEVLQKEFYLHVFLKFKMWLYATWPVQKEFFAVLLGHIAAAPGFFKSLCGIHPFLDALRNYYWLEVPSDDSPDSQVVHPITKEVLGTRPRQSELLEARQYLLRAIERLSLQADEFTKLLFYLQECNDPPQLIDVSQSVLKLMCAPNAKDFFVSHFRSAESVYPFASLLSKHNEWVRIIGMKLLGKALEHGGKKSKFVSEFGLSWVASSIEAFRFSENEYAALLELLLGRISMEVDAPVIASPSKEGGRGTTPPLPSSAGGSANLVLDGTGEQFAHPHLLPVLFRLLLGSDFSLRQRVLQDLMVLLSNSEETAVTLVQQTAWQNWFFSLLSDSVTSGKGAQYEFTQDMTMKLFNIIFKHYITNHRDGWQVIHETSTFLWLFAERKVLSYQNIMRNFFLNLLRPLESDLKRSEYKPNLFSNIAYLTALVSDFVYFPHPTASPSSVNMYRDQEGKWEDYELVNKTLEVVFLTPIDSLLATAWTHGESLLAILLRMLVMVIQETPLILSAAQTASFAEKELAMKRIETTYVICIDRMRTLVRLTKDNTTNDTTELMIWTLASLIKVQKKSSKSRDVSAEILVPLLKELLLFHSDKMEIMLMASFGLGEKAVLADTTSIPIFMDFFNNSIVYQFNLLQQIDNRRKLVEQQHSAHLSVLNLHREKHISSVQTKLEKESASEIQQEKKLSVEVLAVKQKQQYYEVNRRSENSLLLSEGQLRLAAKWRHLLKEHSVDRWPWNAQLRYWKLDPSEDSLRRRWKLKINFSGNDHRDAVLYSASSAALSSLVAARGSGGGAISKQGSASSDNGSAEKNDSELPKAAGLVASGGGSDSLINVEEETGEMSAETWQVVAEEKEAETAAGPRTPIRVESDEVKKLISTAELVTVESVTRGQFVITQKHMYFFCDSTQITKTALLKDRKWSLADVTIVQRRRYLLQNSALEIFLLDKTSHFINLPKGTRVKVFSLLRTLRPPNLPYKSIEVHETTPAKVFENSGLMQQWLDRKISNFEYLMALNTFAGRTYNDMTQYPVFPWILADYTSETLDLNNPKVYRDLTKPVGALEPNRRNHFIERYEMFEDEIIPKFHYGSHYSSAGAVLFYLIRMEPFTSQFIHLQGGKFDHADRSFFSMRECWNNCNCSTSDVKEMIPEFFYQPQFLINSNKFDLGTRQNGERIGDVELPPWAKTPEEFVRINRDALESEYVSANLHHWIDLIFGYKQRGKAAVEAVNVFYYLTYEGTVDLDAIRDPAVKKSTQAQINHFGQTPSQLFTKPHPQRLPRAAGLPQNLSSHPDKLVPFFQHQFDYVPCGLFFLSDSLMTITPDGDFALHKFSPTSNPERGNIPFQIDINSRKLVSLPPRHHILTLPSCRAVLRDLRAIILAGYWDSSIRIKQVDASLTANRVEEIRKHFERVVCVAAEDNTVVTGSADCTVRVWNATKTSRAPTDLVETRVLFGHDTTVTCVAVNRDLDLVASGSRDGTVLLHSIRKGRYFRSVSHPKGKFAISKIALSSEGHVVFYSEEDTTLYSYSINGRELAQQKLPDGTSDLYITKDAKTLLTCGSGVPVRRLLDLEVQKLYFAPQSSAKVSAFAVSADERFLSMSLDDGKLLVFAFNEQQRWTVLGDENLGWVKMDASPSSSFSSPSPSSSSAGQRSSIIGSANLDNAPELIKMIRGPFGKW